MSTQTNKQAGADVCEISREQTDVHSLADTHTLVHEQSYYSLTLPIRSTETRSRPLNCFFKMK